MPQTRSGAASTQRKTIYCPAMPDLYAVLDSLRRERQRQTGQRVTLNAMVLDLVRTHPRVTAKLPQPLPAD
jgi:hypothetical protein